MNTHPQRKTILNHWINFFYFSSISMEATQWCFRCSAWHCCLYLEWSWSECISKLPSLSSSERELFGGFWGTEQSDWVLFVRTSTYMYIYSPQVHVFREVYKLTTEYCNALQTNCIEKVAKKYTCDDFRNGMYVYLAYNFIYLQYVGI